MGGTIPWVWALDCLRGEKELSTAMHADDFLFPALDWDMISCSDAYCCDFPALCTIIWKCKLKKKITFLPDLLLPGILSQPEETKLRQ